MKPTAYFVWNRNGQNTLSFYKPSDLQTEVTELYSADTVKKAMMEVVKRVNDEWVEYEGSAIFRTDRELEAIVDEVLGK